MNSSRPYNIFIPGRDFLKKIILFLGEGGGEYEGGRHQYKLPSKGGGEMHPSQRTAKRERGKSKLPSL